MLFFFFLLGRFLFFILVGFLRYLRFTPGALPVLFWIFNLFHYPYSTLPSNLFIKTLAFGFLFSFLKSFFFSFALCIFFFWYIFSLLVFKVYVSSSMLSLSYIIMQESNFILISRVPHLPVSPQVIHSTWMIVFQVL